MRFSQDATDIDDNLRKAAEAGEAWPATTGGSGLAAPMSWRPPVAWP